MLRALAPSIPLSASLLACAFALPAAAQTPLPGMAPETLAADASVSQVDGRTRVEMRSFDPFEERGDIQGEVWLRTGEGEIGHTGLRLPDGAVVEVEATYIAPTDDPRDFRSFERARFVSGEAAQLVRYRTDVLECSSRVRRTDYRDDYYLGASHGLRMGVFGAYPAYRGFRDYGYSQGYGDRGLSRAYGRGGHGVPSGGTNLRLPSPRTPAADRRREPATIAPPRGTPRTVTPGVRTGTGIGPLATPIPSPERRDPVATEPRAVERARRGQASPRLSQPLPQRRRVVGDRTPGSLPSPRASNPTPRSPVRSNPTRNTSTPSRSAPVRAATPRRAEPPRRSAPPKRQSISPRPGKSHDLYPPLEPVDGQCAVRESIGVFVPWARVDAARFDGLSVVLVDRDGREVPVWVPPNYVEGFRLATRR